MVFQSGSILSRTTTLSIVDKKICRLNLDAIKRDKGAFSSLSVLLHLFPFRDAILNQLLYFVVYVFSLSDCLWCWWSLEMNDGEENIFSDSEAVIRLSLAFPPLSSLRKKISRSHSSPPSSARSLVVTASLLLNPFLLEWSSIWFDLNRFRSSLRKSHGICFPSFFSTTCRCSK